MSAPPWADVGRRQPIQHQQRSLLVDLARCIGCHACSVACKTEHGVPLGTFRMRVRWLPRPDRPTFAFVPVFDAELCDLGANRAQHGLPPACVGACPTQALQWGEATELPAGEPLDAPEANLHPDVTYLGGETWLTDVLHKGAALDPRDPDITYEQ